jgi:PAS domain S-box-containing protein
MQAATNFESLVNALGDAVCVCDKAGTITFWNPGAERMFGFSKAEAEGASLDIIIPEKQRKRHWDGYFVTMESGVTKYGNDVLRVPALTRSGATISIAFTVAMLLGDDGKPNAIASVMRDETEKFNKERALRKRLAELEAQLRGQTQPAAAVAQAHLPAAAADEAPSGCPFAAAGGA